MNRTSSLHRWIPTAGILLLIGCSSSAPEFQPPDLGSELPDHWLGQPGASLTPAQALWWQSFNDPLLDELVDEAIARNHDLTATAERIYAAAAQADLAGAQLWPQIDATGSGQRNRTNFIGLPIPGNSGDVLSRTFSSYGVSLTASWELDLWGRLRAAQRSAVASAQAAVADWEAARESLAAQVAKAYFAVIEARLQIELAQTTVTSFERSATQVEERFRRGTRNAEDLHLARNTLATGRAQLEFWRRADTAARRQLELLLGRYPSGRLGSAADLPPVPEQVPAGLPAELLTRRPDVRAAERRFASASASVASVRKELFPRLSLTSSAGTTSNEASDLVDSDFFVWNVAGNLLQPIFDAGRIRSRIRGADASSREAAARYAQIALRAYGDVEIALSTERHLRERGRFLEEAAEAADRALAAADTRYRGGTGNYLTVLEAQRRVLGARSQALSVRREQLEVRSDLHLALGGAFPPPPNSDQNGTSDPAPTHATPAPGAQSQ